MTLLEKLKLGTRNIKAIKFPGTDETVGLKVLTEAEVQEAVFSAERLFKSNGIEVGPTTLGRYQAETNIQLLSRSLVTIGGTPAPLFKSADELRGVLTRDARDILIDDYNAFEEECSPSPLKMSEEDFNRLFEDLKKNAGAISGNGLNFRTAKGLITYLASREAKSPKANGSTS